MTIHGNKDIQLLARLSGRAKKEKTQPKNGNHSITIDGKPPARRTTKSLFKLDSARARYGRIGSSLNISKCTIELLQVVEEGDYNHCKTLIEKGTDVNIQDNETGYTALHLAARNDSFHIVRFLLQNGADCNVQDNRDQGALHFAVIKDRIYTSQVLLENSDLNINITNKNHDTPLHLAAKEGRYEICQMILKHRDVKVNAKNKKVMTPLHYAAEENHGQIIQLLLDNNADWRAKDAHSFLSLHIAANKGFPDCCQVLISKTLDADKEKHLTTCLKDGKTPIMLAAKGGHHNCCTVMKGQNINATDKMGNTALHYATISGFENTTAELLRMGADPNTQNKKGTAPVLDAATKKKVGCLKILIEHNANLNVVDKQGRSILHCAAERKSLEVLTFALDLPDMSRILNKGESRGCTPLHLAIKRDAVDCAIYLLEKGSSPTLECVGGMTPLHLAAAKGNTSVCEVLLSKKEVQVNQVNDDKATPLHMAALHGSTDICQMLIRKRARLTAEDGKGRTALHVASAEGYANVVKLLSKRGVPQRVKDDTGSTALHLAASRGNLQCCKVLVSFAKGTCWELDQYGDLPLDRSFKECNSATIQREEIDRHDLVFQYLLENLNFKEKNEELILRLHRYMDTAILERRKTIIKAIVSSCWWEAGISGENGHQCHNFRKLIESYPEMALKLQDKCITRSGDSESIVTYDFRLFEDSYYIPTEIGCLAKNPYDPKTHRVMPHAVEYTEDSLEWKHNHPLNLMISNQRHHMLYHPLTTMWLLQKWKSYIYIIFLGFLFIEVLFTISLTGFMELANNWNHVLENENCTEELLYCTLISTELGAVTSRNHVLENRNFTKEEYCRLMTLCNSTELGAAASSCNQSLGLKRTFWVALLLLTLITIYIEFYSLYKLKQEYFFSLDHSIRILRTIFTIVSLIPDGVCEFKYVILNDKKWQCGIIALLLTWLHLINTLNQLPMLSIFMPVTRSFAKSFFKVVMYIIMIVFVFGFIFHLLLYNQAAFSTVPQAMVKTTVWMLGDLAYDSTFIANKTLYPLLIHVLFLVFVAFLGGFVINFVITQPSHKLKNFREEAYFHRAANRAKLFLKFDICFPHFRKHKTQGKFVDDEDKRDDYTFFMKKLLLLDTREETKPITPVDLLQQQLHKQDKQITELLTLQTEQMEEMKDLKHQLTILIKSFPEQTHL